MRRIDGNADACSDEYLVLTDGDRSGQRVQNALRHAEWIACMFDLTEKNREFISTVARDYVGRIFAITGGSVAFAQDCRNALTDELQ